MLNEDSACRMAALGLVKDIMQFGCDFMSGAHVRVCASMKVREEAG